ncbi:methylenetetrahydrofolate reductase (NADPH) [Ketogulonicigenium robustum]|uniref:Methylenetetrahydrofolate reductase (NADPH) n=1 Tax=Ketogulonicigenium robustum TaxID=92947 RepID=A0A1W6NWY8_9RHOB|nr:5,10-methylenetetrahydrofolate reductase [Ketogulonicigenium robustum]ARO13709.1 methylenetetrahydrofolate reductase (NADPH) [Ketogulonicigenium robustum]
MTTAPLLRDFSIEVTPRSLRETPDIAKWLPRGTTVYIAHIAGTPIDDMVHAARRLRDLGFEPQPHLPARVIPSRAVFDTLLQRYTGEAGVRRALLLGGGPAAPAGPFDSANQLLDGGVFDRLGFTHLHFAGHPEGSPDLDPNGGTATADSALLTKHAFAQRTDARVALVTQFVFDAQPVINWSQRIAAMGIDVPIHVGVAGPAHAAILLRYGLACGIGPSLQVLRKRARDIRRFIWPMKPDAIVADLARHVAAHPASQIAQLHLFPLGGIKPAAKWAAGHIAQG